MRGFRFRLSVFGLRPNTCRPAAEETKLPIEREKKPLVPSCWLHHKNKRIKEGRFDRSKVIFKCRSKILECAYTSGNNNEERKSFVFFREDKNVSKFHDFLKVMLQETSLSATQRSKDIYNSFCPLKEVKVSKYALKRPWLSVGLLNTTKRKNKLYTWKLMYSFNNNLIPSGFSRSILLTNQVTQTFVEIQR